jgi:hypothetical protein
VATASERQSTTTTGEGRSANGATNDHTSASAAVDDREPASGMTHEAANESFRIRETASRELRTPVTAAVAASSRPRRSRGVETSDTIISSVSDRRPSAVAANAAWARAQPGVAAAATLSRSLRTAGSSASMRALASRAVMEIVRLVRVEASDVVVEQSGESGPADGRVSDESLLQDAMRGPGRQKVRVLAHASLLHMRARCVTRQLCVNNMRAPTAALRDRRAYHD